MNKASERQAKYDAAHIRRFGFKLNLELDADIIAKLESEPSMQGYIKRLIRADIEKSKQ